MVRQELLPMKPANIFGQVYPRTRGIICQGSVYGHIVTEHAASKELVDS